MWRGLHCGRLDLPCFPNIEGNLIVMGENYGSVGFANVNDMVGAMCASDNQQLAAVVAFIIANGLQSALRSQNWVSYAGGYNGPDYEKNSYDSRQAAAYSS